MESKVFHCPNCDQRLQSEEADEQDAIICDNCGHGYRITHDALEEEYRLVPIEPPEFPEDIDTERI